MVRVVSLFSGIGNADAGLYAAAVELGADVKVVAAYDSDPKCVEVYNANHPPIAQVADVKQLMRSDLPPHDLVIGGPPCQPFSLAGKRAGHADRRNCLPDFIRLTAGVPYLMENVVPRLIPSVPFSVKLNAFDFGDVTTRKRWFYSNYLLHVIETPGPRRFGDIRDHEADRVAIDKRLAYNPERFGSKFGIGDEDVCGTVCRNSANGGGGTMIGPPTRKKGDVRSNVKMVGVAEDDDALCSLTQTSFHGHKNNGSGNPTERSMVAVRGRGRHGNTEMLDDVPFGSLTGESGHRGGPLKIAGQSRPTQDDDALGSLTSGKGGSTGFLKVGLRGHSASASAFDDDDPLGSLISNSWHGNEMGRLGPSVRCPSLLEMARAHSIPDTFDWCGATKTARGKMIANSWPIGMATAVCRAMLVAMGAAEVAA